MVRHLIIAVAVAVVWCSPPSLSGPLAANPVQGDPAASAEPRLALVIGNSAYNREAPLRNPVNDAKAMASTLQRLGFEVLLLTDAPLRQMQQAILDFGGKLKMGGVGLFYFAGHGLQMKGQNYLVPVDADIASEAAVRIVALPVDLVTEQMDEAANRVNIIILDACRNNPFERRLRGASRGLAAMDAARGTLVAYATAPGAVTLDGDGENGLYTSELLKVLGEPDLKAEDVFKRVRTNLVKRTAGRQTPWESSSLTGDFVFNLTITLPPPAPSAGGFDERQMELSYWNSIKDSASPALFRSYLERYPQGTFAAIAQFKLEELERKLPQTTVVTPPPSPQRQKPQQQPTAAPQPSEPLIIEKIFRYDAKTCSIDTRIRFCAYPGGVGTVTLRGDPNSHDFLLTIKGELQPKANMEGTEVVWARPFARNPNDVSAIIVHHIRKGSDKYAVNETTEITKWPAKLKDIKGVYLHVDQEFHGIIE